MQKTKFDFFRSPIDIPIILLLHVLPRLRGVSPECIAQTSKTCGIEIGLLVYGICPITYPSRPAEGSFLPR